MATPIEASTPNQHDQERPLRLSKSLHLQRPDSPIVSSIKLCPTSSSIDSNSVPAPSLMHFLHHDPPSRLHVANITYPESYLRTPVAQTPLPYANLGRILRAASTILEECESEGEKEGESEHLERSLELQDEKVIKASVRDEGSQSLHSARNTPTSLKRSFAEDKVDQQEGTPKKRCIKL